jgi:hypothetical protein
MSDPDGRMTVKVARPGGGCWNLPDSYSTILCLGGWLDMFGGGEGNRDGGGWPTGGGGGATNCPPDVSGCPEKPCSSYSQFLCDECTSNCKTVANNKCAPRCTIPEWYQYYRECYNSPTTLNPAPPPVLLTCQAVCCEPAPATPQPFLWDLRTTDRAANVQGNAQ